ncbi:MAG: SDR family oxidoreductase [Alphaproteobacteria bacterium]|nr:SDR family oxidoreductase [Alphaproteobacteria bacterium]
MATVLITGANRGIGLEFTRQYAADGWHVIAACRNPAEAADLDQVNGDVVKQALDVGDQASVAALSEAIAGEPVDVLINNAGVYLDRNVELGEFDYDDWRGSFEINVIGPMRLAEALVGNVSRSKRRLMVFVTSQMGSIGDNTTGGAYSYRASKAALNAAVKSLSIALKPREVACLLLHPGWVRTDMGGKNATLEVRDSVNGMRKVIEKFTFERSGGFLRYNGETVPW